MLNQRPESHAAIYLFVSLFVCTSEVVGRLSSARLTTSRPWRGLRIGLGWLSQRKWLQNNLFLFEWPENAEWKRKITHGIKRYDWWHRRRTLFAERIQQRRPGKGGGSAGDHMLTQRRTLNWRGEKSPSCTCSYALLQVIRDGGDKANCPLCCSGPAVYNYNAYMWALIMSKHQRRQNWYKVQSTLLSNIAFQTFVWLTNDRHAVATTFELPDFKPWIYLGPWNVHQLIQIKHTSRGLKDVTTWFREEIYSPQVKISV
jgi:hypothetical protein